MKTNQSLGKLLMLLALLTLASASLATAQTATITYSAQPVVVLDVPFSIDMQMSADDNVKNIKLYTRAGGDLTFIGSRRPANYWLGNIASYDSNALPGNLWYYSVGPDGSTYDAVTGTVTKIVLTIVGNIEGKTGGSPNTGIVSLKPDPFNEVGIFPSGIFTIAGGTVVTITPISSTCGDGVVGYIDNGAGGGIANNGIKDGTEANEACDTGIAPLSGETQGCYSNPDDADDPNNCKFIKSTHKINGQTSLTAGNSMCTFGSTTCQLKALTALERLKAKFNVIFSEAFPSCFPYNNHPETLAPGNPNYVAGSGFCVSGKGVASQFGVLRRALIEYYCAETNPTTSLGYLTGAICSE